MMNSSGLLSKTSESQYRLLTMEGEFLINGNLSLHDGFHSNLDLSTVDVSQIKATQIVSSGTFYSKKVASSKNIVDGYGDCRGDCDCGDCSDECDCQTECACTGECSDCECRD